MKNPILENAEMLQKKNPTTFSRPEPYLLLAIQPGWFVKVCSGGERFWCLVLDIDSQNKLTVAVDNELVCADSHGLKYGDIFRCEMAHIYSVSR